MKQSSKSIQEKPASVPKGFLDEQTTFSVPWFFDRKEDKHLIIEQPGPNPVGSGVLVTLLGQVLSSFDPGRVRLLMIDPRELGETFVPFRPFGATNAELISGSIWKSRQEIHNQMQYLTDHVSTVLQNTLTDMHDDIDAYNEVPGAVLVPYHFGAIAGFPEEFDQDACANLERVLAKGPRCGVHVFMTWDRSQKQLNGMNLDTIRRHGMLVTINESGDVLDLRQKRTDGLQPRFDARPEVAVLRSVVDLAGRAADGATKPEVDFDGMILRILQGDQIMGRSADFVGKLSGQWSASSAQGLVIPLGQATTNSIQPLILGTENLPTSAIMVGRPGMGKTNTLHVIVSSLAQMYSPDEVEMYLIDFKDGVSFRPYADHRLPHAKFVGLRSDAELGGIVMDALVKEMERRNGILGDAGVQNIDDYRRRIDLLDRQNRMPRIVLILDEFQTMLEPGTTARENAQLLDVLIRKGRSAGIHVILATQSLIGGGVEQINSTIALVPVRMLLRCTEADSARLLGSDDTQGARLPKGGVMLFNNEGGNAGKTLQLQVAKVDTVIRLPSALKYLRHRSDADGVAVRGPIVFRDNNPADLTATPFFEDALRTKPSPQLASQATMVVGAPVSLDSALRIDLQKSGSQNLVIIEKRQNLALGMMIGGILSLLAAKPPDLISVDIIDCSDLDPDHGATNAIAHSFPDRVSFIGLDSNIDDQEIGRAVSDVLAKLLKQIEAARKMPRNHRTTRILAVMGLHKLRMLRKSRLTMSASFAMTAKTGDATSRGPSPTSMLSQILNEGPEVGVHCMIWCDSPSNMESVIERSQITDFDWRIVGKVSEKDAGWLLDRSSQKTGEHNRASLYCGSPEISVTTMWPFDMPGSPWIRDFADRVALKWRDSE